MLEYTLGPFLPPFPTFLGLAPSFFATFAERVVAPVPSADLFVPAETYSWDRGVLQQGYCVLTGHYCLWESMWGVENGKKECQNWENW